MSPKEERAAHRRGELYAKLSRLVAEYGLGEVKWVLAVVEEDCATETPERPKSIRHAATYQGRLVTDSPDAILWFVPSETDPRGIYGQARWIPRALVVSAIDRKRALGEPVEPLGVLTTTRPIEWHAARLIGGSIRWLDGQRRAS